MTASIKNYKRGVKWILLSPLLFFMAAISIVESLDVYSIQLTCCSIVSFSGVVTGVGFLFGWPWVELSAKILTWVIVVYFVGSWILILLFFGYNFLFSG